MTISTSSFRFVFRQTDFKLGFEAEKNTRRLSRLYINLRFPFSTRPLSALSSCQQLLWITQLALRTRHFWHYLHFMERSPRTSHAHGSTRLKSNRDIDLKIAPAQLLLRLYSAQLLGRFFGLFTHKIC